MNKYKIIFLLFISNVSFCQEPAITSVPFLNISPDARASSMGRTGVATLNDFNASFWNSAKYALTDYDAGGSFSHIQKLNQLVDTNISYLSGFLKVKPGEVIAASFTYYRYDEMIFSDKTGDIIGAFMPKDFSFDMSYSKKLSQYYSVGLTFRYIHSRLSNPQAGTLRGNAFAADIGVLWSNPDLNWFGNPTRFSWGVNISNLGTKMLYNGIDDDNFLPTNLRYGVSIKQRLGWKSTISFNTDFNKLLVPSHNTPNYNNMSLLESVWSSLTYAPNGIGGKFQELVWSLGVEYNYDNLVSFRTGYYYDNPNRGNQQFFSFGCGITLGDLILDTSYSIPTGKTTLTQNILMFSLIFKTNEIYRKQGGNDFKKKYKI